MISIAEEIQRDVETARAFEIILSRVPMHDALKRELQANLANIRATILTKSSATSV